MLTRAPDCASISAGLRQWGSRLRVLFLFLVSFAGARAGRGHRGYALELRGTGAHLRRWVVAVVALAPLQAMAFV